MVGFIHSGPFVYLKEGGAFCFSSPLQISNSRRARLNACTSSFSGSENYLIYPIVLVTFYQFLLFVSTLDLIYHLGFHFWWLAFEWELGLAYSLWLLGKLNKSSKLVPVVKKAPF